MQQRHTTRKFRLDRRCARYRELNFPGRPQIAWLGPSCGFHVAYRKETTCQRNNENGGTVISKHLRLSCPYATTSQMASAAKKQPLLVLAGSLKLENDFATAFSLRSMRDCGLRFAQRISFLHFCFEQAALCHFEQWLKRFHAFLLRRVIVPFIDPDAPEPEVFENQQTIWNFQRLQTHRAVGNHR